MNITNMLIVVKPSLPEFGKDYINGPLERIREISAGKRRLYQKITDIFEQCSIDFVENSAITQKF